MSKQIEFNSKGFEELLKSQEVKGYLKQMADEIIAKSGDGYVVIEKQMPTRNIAIVRADTKEAFQDNLDNNTLLKVIGNV